MSGGGYEAFEELAAASSAALAAAVGRGGSSDITMLQSTRLTVGFDGSNGLR